MTTPKYRQSRVSSRKRHLRLELTGLSYPTRRVQLGRALLFGRSLGFDEDAQYHAVVENWMADIPDEARQVPGSAVIYPAGFSPADLGPAGRRRYKGGATSLGTLW